MNDLKSYLFLAALETTAGLVQQLYKNHATADGLARFLYYPLSHETFPNPNLLHFVFFLLNGG